MKRRPPRLELSLKECYDILKLNRNASLDEVKHAYRVRAFELHPDLNPGNPDAGGEFQKLNEAYVLLSGILQEQEAKNAVKAEAEAKRREEAAKAEEERLAREKARADKRAEREKEREEAFAAREKARAEERAAREKDREERERAEKDKRAREEERAEKERKARGTEQAASESVSSSAEDEAGRKRAAESAYGQGDVLRDLLDDPFARRVFEDIYSEINKKGAENAAKNNAAPHEGGASNHTPTTPPGTEPKSKVLKFEWGDNKNSVNFKNGVGGAVKGWLRHQIDEEQTFRLPRSNLFPGARIRLRIRRGFSEELTTIEIVLPRDFVIGKPVRLRGLGKKVGPWQGDLYLKFEVV